MKKFFWVMMVGLIGLLVIAIAHNEPLLSPEGSSVNTEQARVAVHPSGRHEKDGAVEYRANLALAAAASDASNPLRAYVPTPGVTGRIALEKIYAKGLAATPQSAAVALDLLRSGRLSPDEKIAMAAILYGLHNRENTTGANNDIAFELKMLAADQNKQIAGDAAVFYAGLEYRPGAEDVLKQALERGALESDSYFRALAHLVTSAPPDKQKAFLAEIRASSNRLASDILADALNSGKDFNAAPFLKSSEDMAELLRSTEPQFAKGVGLYGETDAIRYATWMRASAAIESQQTGQSMDEIILAKLNDPSTDPRKVIGYLSSPEAMPLLASTMLEPQVQELVVVADSYANQHPGNRYMGDLVQEIRTRMKNPPPAAPKPVLTMPTRPVTGPEPIPQASPTIQRK